MKGLESLAEGLEAFSIVEVSDVPQMPQIERNVRIGLRDQYDLAPQRMSNPDLIKHVGVPQRPRRRGYGVQPVLRAAPPGRTSLCGPVLPALATYGGMP